MLLFSVFEWWATYPAGTMPPVWLQLTICVSAPLSLASFGTAAALALSGELQLRFTPAPAWGFFLLILTALLVR